MKPQPFQNLARGAALLLALIVLGCSPSRDTLAPGAAPSGDGLAREAPPAEPSAIGGEDALDREDAQAFSARATPIDGPTRITEPGAYRLTRGFDVTSGDGIVIAASHVKLWLGEHRITGPGNKLGRAIVIEDASHVLVRGGRLERFGVGVQLTNTSNSRVRGVHVQGGDETANPPAGNPPQIGILLVQSAMNQIVDNRLRDVNLGLFVRGGESYRNQLARNHVLGGQNGLLAICYNPASGAGPVGPREDRVSFNVLSRFGTGVSASAESAENTFAHNWIRYFDAPYEDLNGTNEFRRNHTQQLTR